jgi:glucans biosynthesis protein C
MKERRYDIDWLRVIAMLCVFVFHCTRFFDTEDWHLKAAVNQQVDPLGLVRGYFMWVWLMELFFLVSGFAAGYALMRRTGGQYLLERVKRLLIPLYTVGLFILVPPQVYFERLTHGQISGSFWQWLPGYFRGLPGETFVFNRLQDPVNWVTFNYSGHLWFIQMLFLISLITLGALLFFKSQKGQAFIASLAGWSLRPGGILLFVIPLAVVRVALYWLPATTDRTWPLFLWYALYFMYGYLFAKDGRFTESVKKHGWLCLALWLVLFPLVGLFIKFVLNFDASEGKGFSLLFAVWQTTYALVSWSSIVFLLSLGAKYLNFTNRFLAYSNEAVLPFYLFHQTIILIAGWFVLPLEIPGLAKFGLIALVSFPTILVLYEVCVRRWNWMRFLFGMQPIKKQAVAGGVALKT